MSENRVRWTPEMDSYLTYLCSRYEGNINWQCVLEEMNERFALNLTQKKCDSRWFGYLYPNAKRKATYCLGYKPSIFTPEDDAIIVQLHGKMSCGEISRLYLPGKTAGQIRHRWNHSLAKRQNPQQTSTPVQQNPPVINPDLQANTQSQTPEIDNSSNLFSLEEMPILDNDEFYRIGPFDTLNQTSGVDLSSCEPIPKLEPDSDLFPSNNYDSF